MTKRQTLEAFLAAHPKKYLIFDFDKTLFELHLPWGEYLENIYALLKAYDADFFTKEAISNETNYQLINKFTREFGSEPRDITLAYAKKFEVEKLTGVSPCEAQLAFLDAQHTNYDLFVWTSNCTTTIEPILKEKGYHSMFKHIIGRDSVTYCKPDPDGFNQIKEYVVEHIDSNAKLEDFLMIGDSNSDEGAAYHANIDFFRVL